MKEFGTRRRNIDLKFRYWNSLEEKILALKKETFQNLELAGKRVQLFPTCRGDRPYALDYNLNEITTDFCRVLHGDCETVKDDKAIEFWRSWRILTAEL